MSEPDFTKKGAKNRDLILDRAIRYLGRTGYARSSLRKLAQACRTSAPRLKYYFGTEEELFAAAIQKMVGEGRGFIADRELKVEAVSEDARRSSLVLAYLQGMSDWLQSSAAYRRLMLEFYSESLSSAVLRKVNMEVMRAGRDRLAFYFLRDPQGTPSAELLEFAERMHDLITGGLIKALVREGEVQWDELTLGLYRHITWSFEQS
jgi:AcrR family transcriptional regulator